MLELRQFDLELAFPRARPLGKNIEDERRAVEDLAIEHLLEVAALGRGEFVVKDDRIDIRLAAMKGELIRLALADVSAGAGRGHFLDAVANDVAASGRGQLGELLQRTVCVPLVAGLEFHAN